MIIPPSAALALAMAVSASPTVPVPPEGGRGAFALSAGQTRRHVIALRAGEYLEATVHQRGTDVIVRLVAPDGAVLVDAVDSSEGEGGMEPASLLATVDGIHAIEVSAPEGEEGVDGYALESAAPRPPLPRDLLRLDAERKMVFASRLMVGKATRWRRRVGPELRAAPARYAQAEAAWAALGETCWQAEAATCLGISQMWNSDYDQSAESLDRGLGLWLDCGDEPKLAEVALFMGRQQAAAARFREAAEIYEHGLAHAEGRYPILELQFVVQLTSMYGQLGDSGQAIRYGERALPELRRREYHQGVGMTLNHLARAHRRRGALERASELLQESLPILREMREGRGELTALDALTEIWDALGEPEMALEYVRQAIDRHAQSLPELVAPMRSRMASILARSGRPEEALELLATALDDARRIAAEADESEVLLQRARLFVDTADWPRALADARAAVALQAKTGDRFAAARAQHVLGLAEKGAGDRDAAATALAQSLELRREIGDRTGQAVVLHDQARLLLEDGALDDARRLLEDARSIGEAQRDLLATPELRATWTASVRTLDETYVDLLAELARRRPGEGYDVRSFEAAEAAAARSLLEVLSAERGALPGAPDLAERERSVREQLATALDRQLRARAAGRPAEVMEPLARDVREISAELQRIRGALRASAGDDQPALEPLGLRAVQARLLDRETTLLSFFVGADRGHAWVVGADRLQSYEIPGRLRIEQAVADVRAALEAPPVPGRRGRDARALRALAGLVLPKDRRMLKGPLLVVVADGALHHVPFAALLDAGDRPLVERLVVASVPSASVAAALRRRQDDRSPAPHAVAVVADPVYDAADGRVGSGRVSRMDARVARATRDFGFRNGRLPRLSFTRREATAITALAPGTSRALLDFDANVEAALSEELASYRYVHFAAHGLLNDARPELSGIVLSLVDRAGRPRPGLLTAPDVSRLRLQAELVVLSSCRSAAGREVRGEGLVGLTRAFMSAGAPRVVASLWPVDDIATSAFMSRMYREMLGPRKASPAVALRAAQREMRRHRRWRAPYYWAGFQLQGDWR